MAQRGVVLTLLILAVTSTALARVESTVDESIDFTAYKTYAWQEGVPSRNPSVQKVIVEAVDLELQARGLRLVEQGADLYVATYILVDRHSLEELSDPTQWEFWTGQRAINAYQVQAGTLVIDLIDAGSQKVAWRALSSKSVKGALDRIKDSLPRMVRKMFRQFPQSQP
jgi:hypothetical protein